MMNSKNIYSNNQGMQDNFNILENKEIQDNLVNNS
jgi:hypothetical protein